MGCGHDLGVVTCGPQTLPVAFDARWEATGELATAADALHSMALGLEARHSPRLRNRRPGPAAKYRAAVAALVCNVAAVELVAPGRVLATPRTPKWQAGTFGEGFAQLLDTLAAGSLIQHWPGEWTRETSRHEVSRSAPTIALLDCLPAQLSAGHLRRAVGESIELRARRNALGQVGRLRVPATDEARRMSAELDEINAWLSAASFTRQDRRELWLHERAGMLPRVISTQDVHLRRVFNNGTLAHGGRLFSGWWQNMRKAERAALIEIEGERAVDLDFTAMVPRLCYAIRKVPWPFGAERDAPYIAGPRADRAAWKEWTLALLFAQRPMRSWPGKSAGDRLAFAEKFGGMRWTEARDLVLQRHAGLAAAGGFCCELGMEAMRLESDITVAVLLALKGRGIVALPNHDGFAVRASRAEEAEVVLAQVAQSHAGAPMSLTHGG